MIPIFIPESLECGANIRSEAHLYGSLIHKLINAHIWEGEITRHDSQALGVVKIHKYQYFTPQAPPTKY